MPSERQNWKTTEAARDVQGVRWDLSQAQLSQPINIPCLIVPERVGLREARNDKAAVITWKEVSPSSDRASAGCLRAFLRLQSAKPETVLKFVQKWGPLGIVKTPHQWSDKINLSEAEAPWREILSRANWHDAELVAAIPDIIANLRERQQENSLLDDDWWFYEPVDVYPQYARQVNSILSLAISLRDGREGKFSDWQHALMPTNPAAFKWPERLRSAPDLSMQCYLVAEVASWWLRQANTFPIIRWGGGEDRPELTLEGARRQVATGKSGSDLINWHYEMHRHMGLPLDGLQEVSTSLLSVIALQLAAALTSAPQSQSLPSAREYVLPTSAHCFWCHEVYTATRKPRAKQRPNCGTEECLAKANRARGQRSRDHKRQSV